MQSESAHRDPGAPRVVDRVVDDRYRVLSHLADGGMARVYRARDLRLDRDVALKIMRADLAEDAAFVQRFRREAQSAARLSHPNVVAVHDQGSAQGLTFLVMELVDGHTLREEVDARAPCSPRRALDLLEPVLAATAAAHAAGLVHRDLKPENILIRRDGVIKVADFGLARAVTASTLTRNPDLLWGTAAYLAPEQIESGQADPRSDVYALGLVLIELLTGRRAVRGESAIQIAYQHVHGEVPRPSDAVDGVPAELDHLVLRATARDPQRRPEDARALLALLRRTRAALSEEELDRRPVPRATDTRATPTSTPRPTPASASASRTIDHARTARAARTQPRSTDRTEPRPDGAFARTTGNRSPRGAAAPAASASTRTRPVPRPAPVAPARGRRRRRVALVLVALLLLGGGATAGWWYTAGPGAYSAVPDLTGFEAAAAEGALQTQDLQGTRRDAFSETVPAGIVITTVPDPGVELRHGDSVELTVSRGPERLEVPAVLGVTESDATDALLGAGLVLGEVDRPWSSEAPEGEVIGTDPAIGEGLPRDTPVDLTISAGPEPIDVPGVVDLPEDEALAVLEEAGLEGESLPERVFSDTVAEGSVVTQDPVDGTLEEGEVVTLTLSQGPELFEVPSVIGLGAGQAEQELRDAGFEVETTPVLGAVILDQVYSMSVDPGDRVPAGTVIVLGLV